MLRRLARAIAVVFALLVVVTAGDAAAQQGASPRGSMSSPYSVVALTGAVVVVAFLVNRFAPKKRKNVRRTAISLILYLAALGASFGLGFSSAAQWAQNCAAMAELFAIFAIVNIVVILVFDLLLPALSAEPATIVVDLVVGLAYIVATLAILRKSGVDLSGIVTTSAVVTGILALSLQTTLGNILGGIALQLDNSIRAGDWIQLDSGKQGKVKEIRWRHTVIETRDWDTLIVPNAALLAANITILGKRDGESVPHRMWVYFNVDFRYAPADVIQAVETALRGAPIQGVASDPAPNCVCMDFAKEHKDSFGYYAVRYWLTDLARDDPTSSAVRARVYSALQRAKIPLAVPGAHIWLEQDSEERRARKSKADEQRRIDAVSTLEFLKPLTDEEKASVARQLRFAPFAAGEVITRQGAVAHWLYIVTDGTAEVHVQAAGGDKVVATISAPGFFGEMGLMTGEPRRATVVAATDVDCYRLDKDVFREILSHRPEIATEVSVLLAQRRVELQAAQEDLDAAAKSRRIDAERTKILAGLKSFFALDDKRGVA